MNRHNYFEVGAFLGMFLMGQLHVLIAVLLLMVGHMISPEMFLGQILMTIYALIGVSAHIKAMALLSNAKDGSYVDKILSEAKEQDANPNVGATKQGILWRVKHEFKYMKDVASLSFLDKKTT